jgi:capsular polysaccharide transport system permease protein
MRSGALLDHASGFPPARRPWSDAARQQIRVIAALLRRETRAHFGDSRLGYLWAIIEPILHLLAFAVVFAYILPRHAPLGHSLLLFMLTGLMPYFLYYKLATYVAGAIEGNRALLNLPPVKPLDVVVARGILEAVTYLLVGFILLVGLFLSGTDEAVPNQPTNLAAALMTIVVFGFGLGLINAVIRVFIYNWVTIFSLFLGPLYLLSGIWFLPEQVPPPFRDYLLYNPIMHFLMWVRTGFYRGYNPDYLDRFYAVTWSVAMLVAGLALFRVARRKLLEPT